MTYSSASIVYGVDLTEDRKSPFRGLGETISELRDRDLVDSAYNGMNETPYWIGAELGSIDATSSSLQGCRLEPTDADKVEFEAKMRALLDHLDASDDGDAARLAGLLRQARPESFLAWSSS